MNIWHLNILILFVFASSCSTKTDNKTYSLALLFPKNFNAELVEDTRMNYESIFVSYKFFELQNSELLIYKNEANVRKLDTIELSDKEVQEFKKIVVRHLNKPFEGRFMDTISEFKWRCCDGCTTFVTSIKDENSRLEQTNLSKDGLESEKSLIAFIEKIESKANYEKMNRIEFIESVLFAEQFANLQFPLPPQIPFKPPKIK